MDLFGYEQHATDTRRTAVLYQGLSDTAAEWARFLSHGAIHGTVKSEAIRAQNDSARLSAASRLRAEEHRHAAALAASVALHPSSRPAPTTSLEVWDEPDGEQPREHPIGCVGLHDLRYRPMTWAVDGLCDTCRARRQLKRIIGGAA